MSLHVRVPASSANLGAGFDCLGLSLPLYTTVRMRPAAQTEVRPVGDLLADTPADQSNYVYRCMTELAREVGRPLPPLRLEIESEIPLARGLGSSAAALLAGLLAANVVLGRPLDEGELLNLASRLEGHPDNVVPALLGGIVVATFNGQKATPLRIVPPSGLGITLLIPDFQLDTVKARSVLPDTYSRADAVFTASHAALTVGALLSGRLDLLQTALQDRLHQPYRAPLVPGLEEVLLGAAEHGALGAALSGAGPTVLCLHDTAQSTAPLHDFLHRVMVNQGVAGRILDLRPDVGGAEVIGEFSG